MSPSNLPENSQASPDNERAASEPRQEATIHIPVKPPDVKVWVTYVIMGVTIFVYLLQLAGTFLLGGDYLLALGAMYRPAILMGEIWRFLTPVVLHVSIAHIAFNMLALYRIGRFLEVQYGNERFFVLYIATAFTGNVFSFLFTNNPSAGASTALFGLITAYAVLLYRNREFFLNAQQAIRDILITILFNLALGMTPGIDNFGHLGGLLGGLAISWFGGPQLALRPLQEKMFNIIDKQSPRRYALVVAVVVAVFALLAAGRRMLG